MLARRRPVGVLLKSTDVVTEGDLAVLCPPPLRLHVARLALNPGESFEAMLPRLDSACAQIKDARPEIIVFACASATFAGADALDRRVAERIEAATGRPVITAAAALIDAARRMEMHRILLVSPYIDEIDLGIRRMFDGVGIQVASVLGLRPREIFQPAFLAKFGGTGNRLIDPAWLPELVADAIATASGVDGVVIACTGLRASEALATLEQDTGLPVVAANQAIAAATQRGLGLRVPVAGFGALLERPPQ